MPLYGKAGNDEFNKSLFEQPVVATFGHEEDRYHCSGNTPPHGAERLCSPASIRHAGARTRRSGMRCRRNRRRCENGRCVVTKRTDRATRAVSARFSASAGTYDGSATVQFVAAEKVMELLAETNPPKRILEIGCGTGLLTRMLVDRFPDAAIEGVDIADSLVAAARTSFEGNSNVHLYTADGRTMRESRTFGLVVSSSSLHWMPPLKKTFEKLAACLVPGGKLVFSMMVDGTLAELRESRLRVAAHKTATERLPSTEEVMLTLADVGFKSCFEERHAVRAHYESATEFLYSIHNVGVTGGPISAHKKPLNRSELGALVSNYGKNYTDDDGVFATYQLLCVVAEFTPQARESHGCCA